MEMGLNKHSAYNVINSLSKEDLAKIITKKTTRINNLKKSITIETLKEKIDKNKTFINFKDKILNNVNNNKISIIAEIKKASPSAGVIIQDYNPLSIAQIYNNNKATCLSVLTEEDFFLGNLIHISKIKEKIKLPILCKDFFIDKFQIYLAKSYGADAILIILAGVTDELANLLADKPNALKAVLLHEIGHVVHQHSVRMTAQSAASTIVLAVIFGDLEGIAEVVLGTGASFAQQGFSRDMEREADSYALIQLENLGYSSNDFADAIEALQGAHTSENEHLEKVNNLLEYLSSHPSAQERIDNARK